MGKSRPKLKQGLVNLKHQSQYLKKKEKIKEVTATKIGGTRKMNRNEISGNKGVRNEVNEKLAGMSEKKQALYRAEKLKHAKMPYSAADRILLLGEGNFSFGSALAKILGSGEGIFATCYDSKEVVEQKYADEAKEHTEMLETLGGKVFYEVDGTALDKHKKQFHKRYVDDNEEELLHDAMLEKLSTGKKQAKPKFWFDKIVFNFPHSGSGIKDQDRNVISNQKLLLGIFKSTKDLLHPFHGELHITIKTGLPYDLWRISGLAKEGELFKTKDCFPFDPSLYPGYEHRRTLGFKEGKSQLNNAEIENKFPKTYIFTPFQPDKNERDPDMPQAYNPPKKRKQYKNR